MHCPFCGADDTKVIDSRLVADGDQVRRRRECQTCGERFTTFETAELVMPRIVKRDGIREPFMHRLRSSGERELPSRMVGEEVMRELRQMDGVAYVRFASVYRDFQDVSEFQEEIRKLTKGRDDEVAPRAKTKGDL